jgi:hypothetical protein
LLERLQGNLSQGGPVLGGITSVGHGN